MNLYRLDIDFINGPRVRKMANDKFNRNTPLLTYNLDNLPYVVFKHHGRIIGGQLQYSNTDRLFGFYVDDIRGKEILSVNPPIDVWAVE